MKKQFNLKYAEKNLRKFNVKAKKKLHKLDVNKLDVKAKKILKKFNMNWKSSNCGPR